MSNLAVINSAISDPTIAVGDPTMQSMHVGGMVVHPVGGMWQDPNVYPSVTAPNTGPYYIPSTHTYPYPATYPGTIGPGSGGWTPNTIYPGSGGAVMIPSIFVETKMNLSIYRNLEEARAEVAKTNPKVRWTGADYRIDGVQIEGVGVDLELQYWKDQCCDGEVILSGDMVWFSDRKDAKLFEEEFIVRIGELANISDFEKPWPDIREFLNYHREGQAITFAAVVTVRDKDLFENSFKLTDEGIKLWFMLKAGSVGKVFYFEAESTFAFENAADAVLFAAYMTEADKPYGDMLQNQDEEADISPAPLMKPKRPRKPRGRKTGRQSAMEDLIKQILKEQQDEEDEMNRMQDMWTKLGQIGRFGPTWSAGPEADLADVGDYAPARRSFYPKSLADPDLKKYVRGIRTPSDLLKLHGSARATLSARHTPEVSAALEALEDDA